MSGMERAVAECGQWWWLCGPSMDLRTPGYWIGSMVGSVIWFIVGYTARGLREGSREQP